MRKGLKFTKFAISIFAALIFLSSCAHITHPYIDASDPQKCQAFLSAKSFSNARACNQQLQSNYLDAMSNQANLSSWTGITLLPLTAYTSGLAIKGDNANKVTDFTLGGAAAFGLSSWLSKPDRAKIYGAGLVALQCALTASNGFDQDIVELDTKLMNVLALVTGVREARLDVDEDPSTKGKVDDALYEAELLLTNAEKLKLQFRQASVRLFDATRTINNQINIALASSVQSVSSLPGVIRGMTTVYSDLGSIYPTLKAPVGTDLGDRIGLESTDGKSLIELDDLVKQLLQATERLSIYLNAITPVPLTDQLEQCGVEPDSIVQPLSLSRNKITFASVTAAAQAIIVEGGSGQYVHDGGDEWFAIKQQSVFGPVFGVKPKSDANPEPGEYIILIRDTTGGRVPLTLVLLAQEQGGDREDDEAPIVTSGETCSGRNTLDNLSIGEEATCGDKEATTTIQAALTGAYPDLLDANPEFVDGDYGKNTRVAIERFLQDHDYLGSEINLLVIDALQQSGFELESERLQYTDMKKGIADFIKGHYPDVAGETSNEKIVAHFQVQTDLPATGFISDETLAKLCALEGSDNLQACASE